MSSRKPPSQRDPEYVLARTVASLRQVVGASSRMANNTPVTTSSRQAAQLRGAPRPAAPSDTGHAGTGTDSIALGAGATAPGGLGVAIGPTTIAQAGGVAIGTAEANNTDVVAIGSSAYGSASKAVAIGFHAGGDAASAVAIGDTAYADAGQAVAIGKSANASSSTNGIAIGSGATINSAGTDMIAVGHTAVAGGGATKAIAVGSAAITLADNAIALGSSATAGEADTIAIGRNADAEGANAIAIGQGAVNNDADTALIKANSLEVAPQSTTETSVVLADSAGVRWAITVDTTGHLTTALA